MSARVCTGYAGSQDALGGPERTLPRLHPSTSAHSTQRAVGKCVSNSWLMDQNSRNLHNKLVADIVKGSPRGAEAQMSRGGKVLRAPPAPGRGAQGCFPRRTSGLGAASSRLCASLGRRLHVSLVPRADPHRPFDAQPLSSFVQPISIKNQQGGKGKTEPLSSGSSQAAAGQR